jgi:hypothetical protein
MYLPSARKTGMKLTAVSAADMNRYKDGIRSGAWIVNDLGSTWDQAGGQDPDTLGLGVNAFVAGVSAVETIGIYGETMVDATCSTVANIIDGGVGFHSPVAGAKAICVDNSASWVDNCAVDGMPIVLYGTAPNQLVDSYQLGYVTHVCDTGNALCDCGTGKFVGIDGLYDAVGDSVTPYAGIAKLDERYRTDGIVIERITWAPQNPFDLAASFPDENSPIDCAEAYVESQNDPTTYDNICDLSSVFGYYATYGAQLRDSSVATSSSLHAAAIDGSSYLSVNSQFGPGNVIGPGAGNRVMDMSGNLRVHHNLWEGCAYGDRDSPACIAQLGEGSTIEYNTFKGVGLLVCGAGEDDAGFSVQSAASCNTAGNAEYYCGRMIGLGGNINRVRFNRFLAVHGCTEGAVQVGGPDNVFEGNEWIGTIGGPALDVSAAADRTQIRNNTFDFTPGWGASGGEYGDATDRTGSMPINVLISSGPHAIEITGNRARYEDTLTDVTPEEANCLVGLNDVGDAVGIADHWNLEGNMIRGYYSLLCDYDDNAAAEGSWDETFPTPYVGDWINTHSQIRLSWKGTADGFNSRPTCNAAAKGHFYMFYNVADHSCVDPGNDAEINASPCYCDGVGPAWTELDLWP